MHKSPLAHNVGVCMCLGPWAILQASTHRIYLRKWGTLYLELSDYAEPQSHLFRVLPSYCVNTAIQIVSGLLPTLSLSLRLSCTDLRYLQRK
jgi:hypothetical protein